jgi:hypothetical protein
MVNKEDKKKLGLLCSSAVLPSPMHSVRRINPPHERLGDQDTAVSGLGLHSVLPPTHVMVLCSPDLGVYMVREDESVYESSVS